MTDLELGKRRAEELGLPLRLAPEAVRKYTYYDADNVHQLLGVSETPVP